VSILYTPDFGKSYHLQAVLVLKFHLTVYAIGLVVNKLLHMPIRVVLRAELHGARFVWYLWSPMSQVVHMLCRCVLGVELLLTCFARDLRCPMSNSHHMLVRCNLSDFANCAKYSHKSNGHDGAYRIAKVSYVL